MRRSLIAGLFALVLFVAPQFNAPASAGEGCCLCSGCASGPPECSLPPISCDITCQNAGCSGAMLGSQEACNVAAPCGSGPAPAPAGAPAAGQVGLAALLVALGGLGLRRLMRRGA